MTLPFSVGQFLEVFADYNSVINSAALGFGALFLVQRSLFGWCALVVYPVLGW